MIEYGWPLAAPRTLAERIAEMTEAARYLHGDLLDLAADLDAEMHAEPTYHDGYETGRRDEAQAQAALAKRKPEPAEAPRPIDPADVRKGDRVRIITEGVVKDTYARGWTMEPDSCAESWHLLDRPDPDAERAPQPPAVVLPTVGEVAEAILASPTSGEGWHVSGARAALDLIAARLRHPAYLLEEL